MNSLGSLDAFVRAAEARSFTVAGRQLSVSSSAIGKAVARLEERLSVRLLHRSTRSITVLSDKKRAARPVVVASVHEQPVPIFQQLA